MDPTRRRTFVGYTFVPVLHTMESNVSQRWACVSKGPIPSAVDELRN